MLKSKFIYILIIFSVFLNLTQSISFAEIDMNHNVIEDNELSFNNWYTGPCRNGEKTCVKNLILYDGFHELVDELNECLKNVEDDTEDYFLWPLIRKEIAGIGGPVLTFFYPLKGLETELSLATFCHAEKDVLKPTGDTTRGVLGFIPSMWNKITSWFGKKDERVLNPDRGLIGDLTKFLCGDGKEDGRQVTISKEQKEKFIKDILKDLKSQIKKKKYQDNDVIVLSLDLNPKNLQYGLAFDTLDFNPNYDKPLDEYFKPRSFFDKW